jgi:hypothetical protein
MSFQHYHGDDMGRPSKEFQAFDSLVGKLLTVPKSTIHERHAAHKKRPGIRPGPKPKTTQRASKRRA